MKDHQFRIWKTHTLAAPPRVFLESSLTLPSRPEAGVSVFSDPRDLVPALAAEPSEAFSEGFLTEGFLEGVSCWFCSIIPSCNSQ